jgi:hypothetical protein
MAAEEQESGRGFRVQDRRRFASSSSQEARADEPNQKSEEVSAQNDQNAEKTFEHGEAPTTQDHAHDVISFSGFILGLTTQALMFMGEVPPPPGQTAVSDLGAARQTIDLLALLKEKTKGNLDVAENAMLENALFDLRLRYVELAKK